MQNELKVSIHEGTYQWWIQSEQADDGHHLYQLKRDNEAILQLFRNKETGIKAKFVSSYVEVNHNVFQFEHKGETYLLVVNGIKAEISKI